MTSARRERGTTREPYAVGAKADRDPEPDPDHLDRGEDERGGVRRHPPVVTEEEDREAHRRRLGEEEKGAPAGHEPERRPAERAPGRPRLTGLRRRRLRRAAEEQCSRGGRRDAATPRAVYVQASPFASASDGRQTAATSPPIGTLDCRIPRASPRSPGANQCITARPLAAFALPIKAPAEREQHDELAVAVGAAHPGEHDPGGAEPEREHHALARAVGQEAPGQKRRCHSDPERGEHDAGLREREVELGAELGASTATLKRTAARSPAPSFPPRGRPTGTAPRSSPTLALRRPLAPPSARAAPPATAFGRLSGALSRLASPAALETPCSVLDQPTCRPERRQWARERTAAVCGERPAARATSRSAGSP